MLEILISIIEAEFLSKTVYSYITHSKCDVLRNKELNGPEVLNIYCYITIKQKLFCKLTVNQF